MPDLARKTRICLIALKEDLPYVIIRSQGDNMKYTLPRGTKDILPDEVGIWQFIESTAIKLFQQYNYKEIRTPIFEMTDLFTRSIGSTTDIVSKEMYTFLDKSNRSLTLRPEETASVVRACLQGNLIGPDKKVVKLYYLGPMFRYERPQAGRYRQFHQLGIELFGSSDPLADIEVIALGVELFKSLGLKDLEVDINSVGCKACRPAFRDKLKAYFKDNKKNLCKECQARLEYNPLRILDCKVGRCQQYIKNAPAPLDTVCKECRKNFELITGLLEKFGIKYRINNRLVRGLDYYTRTTFEIISKQLGAQNAICGGGRYDTLVEELGGKPTPATGFAVGIERVIEVMKAQNIKVPEPKAVDLFIAALGDAAKKKGFEILSQARSLDFIADMDYLGRSLKAQMKVSNKIGAKLTYIIGEEELKKGAGILRAMKTGEQEEVKFDKITEKLKGLV